MEKADHVYSNHTVPVDKLVEVFSRQEREDLYRRLKVGLETRLTPAQRRRLWMYCVDGLSVEEIARKENVKHQNVSKKILATKKILKYFFRLLLSCGKCRKPALNQGFSKARGSRFEQKRPTFSKNKDQVKTRTEARFHTRPAHAYNVERVVCISIGTSTYKI